MVNLPDTVTACHNVYVPVLINLLIYNRWRETQAVRTEPVVR
jgi:hypothetical protein